MKRIAQSLWREDHGVLSFEWVLLMTLVSVGVVGGIAGARDAIIDEYGDVAQAMLALDQSFTVDFPVFVAVHDGRRSGSSSDSLFQDAAAFEDCDRLDDPVGQGPMEEIDGANPRGAARPVQP